MKDIRVNLELFRIVRQGVVAHSHTVECRDRQMYVSLRPAYFLQKHLVTWDKAGWLGLGRRWGLGLSEAEPGSGSREDLHAEQFLTPP